MKDQYHILNGDALKDRFPKSIAGDIFVARECLVDGDVCAEDLNDLYRIRANFISQNYEGFKEHDYYSKTVSEFEKIRAIPNNVEVNLWFEDDLFCQVNFWFIVHLLSNSNCTIFLVRPEIHNQFGFGGLNNSELNKLLKNKVILYNKDEISRLWTSYQSNNYEELLETGNSLKSQYPFIFNAVEAHLERLPSYGKKGRPIESILQIMKDLNTSEFAPIFKEFNRREAFYGFGDLQVKRLYNAIINTK